MKKKELSQIDDFHKSDNILSDMQAIIESSQHQAFLAVNTLLVKRNWLIGYRLSEENSQTLFTHCVENHLYYPSSLQNTTPDKR